MSSIAWRNAPTKAVDVGGTKLVYRQLGPDTGVPVIFLNHLAAELDRWDPRVVDGIATRRRVIVFDNQGIGASEGKTPTSVEAMAREAVAFIRALGFAQVDLFGFSLGGFIAQVRESRQAGFDRGVPRPIEGHPRLGPSASCRSVAHSSPGSGGEW
jgi:pimeloyl-ACP methyl ester carboxylesterase